MGEPLPAMPKRRLALYLDGTWNQVSDNTNIWRFRALYSPVGADGCQQLAYYSTGLGTKFGEKISGGLFGAGIDTAITSAYEWLMDHYIPGDDIFIFGFSRGAYTARSLAGFISKCGLLQGGAPLGVNQLFARYRRAGQRTIRDLIAAPDHKDFSFEEGWMLKYAQAVPIKFIGVFDTVGELGVPFPWWNWLFGSAYQFLNTGLRQNDTFAFHALAIDEHRKAFAPTLWSNQGATGAAHRPIERTEQRWFTGAHANVGGGYFDDPLPQLPIKWLAQKAEGLGLSFSGPFDVDPTAGTAKPTDSYTDFMWGLYRLYTLNRPYYRPIGVPPKSEGEGVVNINETIDASVFERWRSDSTYRPPGLQDWATAKSVDPAKITTTVRADDPKVVVADPEEGAIIA
jgi:Uncharacterized alpha/beta hydrolase domain (DUF2235)